MKKEIKKQVQQKSQAEIEEPEEIIISGEIETDELDEQNEQIPSDEEPEQIESSEIVPVADIKTVAENTEISNTQKIKAVKRSLENKKYSLDREKTKCNDWLKQADTRDAKATEEYENRKKELEELLRKTTERYEKRVSKTKIQWREYTENYLNTKVKKIEDDIVLLQTELSKLETLEPKQEIK